MNVPTRLDSGRSGRQVLIITSGHLSRNPRVGKEATALANAGFRVTVLRVSNLPEFERYDQQLLQSAPYACISLNRQPGAFGAFAERLYVAFARKMVRTGLELSQAFGPVRGLYRLAQTVPADLTIVHTEGPFAVGQMLQQTGRRIAADFEDWHSEDLLPSARIHRPLRLLQKLERTMLSRCAYTSTTSAVLSAALSERYTCNAPIVVRNTFPPDQVKSTYTPARPPTMLWFSQTTGPGRGLEEFLAAWSLTKAPSRIVLLGKCDPSYRARLMDLCPASRRSDLVFLPPVSPLALPELIATHDIGLALERRDPASRDLTITNKLFQYANAGLAIVASDTSGQREALTLAPEAGLLIGNDDANHAAEKLDEMLDSPERITAMRKAARVAAASVFAWTTDATRLVGAVDSALIR